MKKEIWKDIKGYDGIYQVSNKGRVRSIDRKITYPSGRTIRYKGKNKKITLDFNGYLRVGLSKFGKKKRIYLHRLVSVAFIDNKDNKKEINHKNGVKTDNRIENLEWVTRLENMQHAYETGLMQNGTKQKGSDNPNSKLNDSDVIHIKHLLKNKNITQKQIANKFGVNQSLISFINTKSNWGHLKINNERLGVGRD